MTSLITAMFMIACILMLNNVHAYAECGTYGAGTYSSECEESNTELSSAEVSEPHDTEADAWKPASYYAPSDASAGDNPTNSRETNNRADAKKDVGNQFAKINPSAEDEGTHPFYIWGVVAAAALVITGAIAAVAYRMKRH